MDRFKLLSLVLAVTVLLAAAPAYSVTKTAVKKPKPKPAVVKPVPKPAAPVEWAAKVNNDVISMEWFNRVYEVSKREIMNQVSPEAAEEKGYLKAARKAVLEQIIEAVIIMQWAEREGIEINDKTIMAKVSAIKKGFPTPQEFYRSLTEQGMSVDDLARDIKRQMIVDKLKLMREKNLAVSDEEMKSFYDKNIDLYVQKDKLHLKQLYAKDMDAAIGLKQLAATSETVSWEDLGLVEPGQLGFSDDTAVFALKTGHMSDVITGEGGYYIFKAEERIAGNENKFRDVKDNIRIFLLKEKARVEYLKDLQEEKANAKIILSEKLGGLF